jgi:ATP-dependent RNA helicase RhlE
MNNSNFRTTIRSRSRSFKPQTGGKFSNPNRSPNRYRGYGGGGNQIKSFSDVSKFVKKASDDGFDAEYLNTNNSFSDFGLLNPVKENIASRGYDKPTPIQDQAITPILEGRDLIGIANTGTGKTAAFLIPIINQIFKLRDRKALIVAPTRELAQQINEEFRSFSKGLHLYSAVVIGGANIKRQVSDIRSNPHVVIGTPGRLKDLIEHRMLNLDDFSIFVLDEVDLMVDIGFIQDIKYFISLLPKERQSLFFSATIPFKIHGILQDFVKDPITISVKLQDTSENVDQDIIRVLDKSKKVDQLHDLLIQEGFDKVLIFGRTKHGIERLFRELDFRGFKVGQIHGNKTQGYRTRILKSFKDNQIQILLATDVASRGLDIENVTHVINYELPETYEDYIHRIGRTGRAGQKGQALTFVE